MTKYNGTRPHHTICTTLHNTAVAVMASKSQRPYNLFILIYSGCLPNEKIKNTHTESQSLTSSKARNSRTQTDTCDMRHPDYVCQSARVIMRWNSKNERNKIHSEWMDMPEQRIKYNANGYSIHFLHERTFNICIVCVVRKYWVLDSDRSVNPWMRTSSQACWDYD